MGVEKAAPFSTLLEPRGSLQWMGLADAFNTVRDEGTRLKRQLTLLPLPSALHPA
ncbi:hypothetical protein Q3H58_000607 [Pseudomonas psychrotolerans]|nr:hypothetical protein [Pseudomonas psychrotolerans]